MTTVGKWTLSSSPRLEKLTIWLYFNRIHHPATSNRVTSPTLAMPTPYKQFCTETAKNDKIFAQRHAGTRHSSLHEKVSKFYLRRTVFLRVQLATWGAARVPNTHGEPVLLDPSASKEFCALKQDEKCAVVLFSFHLSGGPFFCGRILHTVGESKIQCMVGRVMYLWIQSAYWHIIRCSSGTLIHAFTRTVIWIFHFANRSRFVAPNELEHVR